MSSSLIWKPVVKQKENYLGAIKYILKQKQDDDGDINMILTSKDISYFLAISHCDGGDVGREAREIMQAITKHGEIHIKEVY